MKNPAKEYLEELGTLKRSISIIEKRIREIDAKNTSLSALRYDKPTVQTSYENSQENGIIRKIDLENDEKLLSIKKRFQIKFELILLQINSIDTPLYKQILLMRYVEDKRLRDIAYELNYEEKYILNAHGRALQEFREKFL